MLNSGSRLAVSLIIAATVVFFDQITKQYVEANLFYGQAVNVFSGLRLVLLHNPGAAFGILSNQSGWQVGFLIGVSLVAILALSVWIWFRREDSALSLLPFVLVLAGAIGNSIDRIRYGFVVDFINLYYDAWSWPTFNVADSAISLGVCMLILNSFSPRSMR